MTFTAQQLNLSQRELDKITAALGNAQQPDPIGDAIREQARKVADYTTKYVVADDRLARLIRTLALWELYGQMGRIPENLQIRYDQAMRELEGIRDGKFPDLKLASPASADLAAVQGAWGSGAKIPTR